MEQIILNENIDEHFYIQIYKYYKNQIINGKLSEGEKLPSIRQLTRNIKVSKTTVESAYNQLVVEGYVNNLPKKGYFVVLLKESFFSTEESEQSEIQKEVTKTYINIGVDKSSFDFNAWKKNYGNVIMEQTETIYTSGEVQGELVLRNSICTFVQKNRGVECNSGQIVIGAGVQYLLGILCSLLKTGCKEGSSRISWI